MFPRGGTQQREGQPRLPERRAHLGTSYSDYGWRSRWMEGSKEGRWFSWTRGRMETRKHLTSEVPATGTVSRAHPTGLSGFSGRKIPMFSGQ